MCRLYQKNIGIPAPSVPFGKPDVCSDISKKTPREIPDQARSHAGEQNLKCTETAKALISDGCTSIFKILEKFEGDPDENRQKNHIYSRRFKKLP